MKRKKLKSAWTEYFNFSSRERRGVFFLACILILQLGIIYYQKNSGEELSPPDSKIVSAILIFENTLNKEGEIAISNVVKDEMLKSYADFNPNQADDETWKNFGLSDKQVSVIKNYISHGGRFRKKSDLKKMYCISEKHYNLMEPYISLPDSMVVKRSENKQMKAAFEPVDIENADSVTLMRLRGIGPVLASRIVKYREKLGGFYTIKQLKEVWGITDSLYESIIPDIVLTDSLPFRLIHLNTDSFNVLSSHPYIRGKIAGLICNYRKQHKSIGTIEELKNLPLITEENFLKLVPYISTD